MLYPLFCRISTDDSLQEILDKLKTRPQYQKIIVSRETGNRTHFHVLLMTTEDDKKNAKQNLRYFITHTLKAEGNTDYAITDTTTGSSKYICTYTVKDGEFLSYGFDEWEIEKFKRASYKKFEKKAYVTEFNKLQTDWLLDQSSIDHYIEDYIKLKHSYNHSVNRNQANQHFTMMLCRKNPRYQQKYIQSFIEDFNFLN